MSESSELKVPLILTSPLPRRQNAHHLSVLRNGSASDPCVHFPQYFRYFLVAVRLLLFLRLNDISDLLFDTLRGNCVTIHAANRAIKEVFEFKYSLWCINVFIGGHSTNGGLVHLNIFCDITKHERFEAGDPVVQEFSLKPNDTFRHSVNGSLPLMNALYELS